MKRKLSAGLCYLSRPGDIWASLRYYWQCHDQSHWLFGSGLLLALVALGFVIVQSITGQQISKEVNCLTLNIYHEARGEPLAGKYAVARVTLNRVASRHYPDSICKVVYQKGWDSIRNRYVGAFSWTEVEKTPSLESKAWQTASKIAEEVFNRQQPHKVGEALFYHADHIRPSWARKKTKVAKIGRHIFYN